MKEGKTSLQGGLPPLPEDLMEHGPLMDTWTLVLLALCISALGVYREHAEDSMQPLEKPWLIFVTELPDLPHGGTGSCQ